LLCFVLGIACSVPHIKTNMCGTLTFALQDYLSWYKDMIAVSVITTVNAALCDYHVRNCDPSPQLTEVCNKVGNGSSSSTCYCTRAGI
jgi:hypothetical protein